MRVRVVVKMNRMRLSFQCSTLAPAGAMTAKEKRLNLRKNRAPPAIAGVMGCGSVDLNAQSLPAHGRPHAPGPRRTIR